MNSEDLLNESNQIAWYQSRALLLMQVYESEQKEKLYKWLNRFEYVADIIGIPIEKMAKFFNKMVHNDVHMLVKQNNPNVYVSKFSYEEIINCYLNFVYNFNRMNPHRKRLKCRNQYEQETIEKYADNLREIYNKCYYKNDSNPILCIQFLNGVRYNEIRKHLSQYSGLLFDEMVAKAIEFVKDNLITYYLDQALVKINAYNPQKECFFYAWLNKFEYVADFIQVPNDKMLEFFNKMVDDDVHKYVRDANPYVNFSELSYKQITDYYCRQFASSCENDFNQIRLFDRYQYEQETIENYADSLRKLYERCNYTSGLEERLCEQFINGCRNYELRKYLREIPSLSFDETVAKAVEFVKINKMIQFVHRVLFMINKYVIMKEGFFLYTIQ